MTRMASSDRESAGTSSAADKPTSIPSLEALLAGPILRRVEKNAAYVWVATSRPAAVVVEVYRAGAERAQQVRVGGGPAESIRLGERLFVHLARATPADGDWPTNELLAYDLRVAFVDGDEPVMALADFDLLEGANSIAYGSSPLPTFFVPQSDAPLRVMHGSCRLLHGRGEDALAVADEAVGEGWDNLDERPTALFLTGDQIYADDVASPLIGHVRDLATALMGEHDDGSVPGIERLSGIAPGDRQDLVREKACFTSAHCDNHLMSFGEFAAMYVCAWNHENWPPTWPHPSSARGKQTAANAVRSRRTWVGQTKALERARAALPGVRRLLANVPTYMIFDDHDVTDDWNLTQEWVKKVNGSKTGKRIIANALSAFWAFQGWGNNPDEFSDEFKATVTEHLGNSEDGAAAARFDTMLWAFDRWSFYAPTSPPILCADTRTQRVFDSDHGAARLIGDKGLRRVASLAGAAGVGPGHPLVLVSPVPVCGFELPERRQKYLVDKVGPYEIDFEAWHSNLRGLVDLMKTIVDEIKPSHLVLLSGDVHYGVNARAAFCVGESELPLIQLVSSGLKHAGVLASSSIEALGRVLKARHERWGWDDPPEVGRLTPLKDMILERPVNTDEWSGVSPVFVAPRDARLLAIEERPDYRECRIYVRPNEGRSSHLMGINNVGFVSLTDKRVEHRLMGRAGDRLDVRTAAVDIDGESLFD